MLIPSDLKKWLKMRMPNCVHSSAILSYIEALEEDVGSKIAEIAKLENRIRQLESAQPKWISVEERYPADDQCVMYVDDGEVAFRIVRGWALRELCEFPEHREVHRITHWMPLPEPPKEET